MKLNITEIKVGEESIYLKKSILGWRIVHPIRENGKINWKNLLVGGSWIKFFIMIIIIAILLGAINEYYSNLKLTSACLRALPDYIDLSIYMKNPLLNNSQVFNF